MIIKIEPYENGGHDNDSRTPNPIPEGYIVVPQELEAKVWSYLPFINLNIVDGVLVDVHPGQEIKIGPDLIQKQTMSTDTMSDVLQGILPFTMKACTLAAADEPNPTASMQSLAQAIAPISSFLEAKNWEVGMTTHPGDIVYDPLGDYEYIFSGKEPMTHTNPLFYPGAQGVYYWHVIPKTKEGTRIYPDIPGIIVSVKRGDNWYDSNGEQIYQWVATDNENCVWPPSEANVQAGLWYPVY